MSGDLFAEIEERRNDSAFMARLYERVKEDAPLLARLRSVETQARELPQGAYEGANRYDTDDEHVLHLWSRGESFDIKWPKRPAPPSPEGAVEGQPT